MQPRLRTNGGESANIWHANPWNRYCRQKRPRHFKEGQGETLAALRLPTRIWAEITTHQRTFMWCAGFTPRHPLTSHAQSLPYVLLAHCSPSLATQAVLNCLANRKATPGPAGKWLGMGVGGGVWKLYEQVHRVLASCRTPTNVGYVAPKGAASAWLETVSTPASRSILASLRETNGH